MHVWRKYEERNEKVLKLLFIWIIGKVAPNRSWMNKYNTFLWCKYTYINLKRPKLDVDDYDGDDVDVDCWLLVVLLFVDDVNVRRTPRWIWMKSRGNIDWKYSNIIVQEHFQVFVVAILLLTAQLTVL